MAKKQMTYLTPKEYLNRVIEADCLEIMNQLPDNSIDMVLCDLPYGTTQNKWDSVIPLDTLWKEYKGCSINKDSISMCYMLNPEPLLDNDKNKESVCKSYNA